MATSNIRIKKICQWCGNEFEAQKTTTQYCCKRCAEHAYTLRHYALTDDRELIVNTARNEWAMKNPDEFGSASSLAVKLGLVENGAFSKAMEVMDSLYT